MAKPRVKYVAMSDAHEVRKRRVAAELSKCVCVCANCHFKIHAGKLLLETAGTIAGVVV